MINQHTGYYSSKKEIKDYSLVIDRKNLLDKPVKNIEVTLWSFKENCDWSKWWFYNYDSFRLSKIEIIATDLSKNRF